MISTDRMTWDASTRTLTSEASDHAPLGRFPWVRAYPDACDLGVDVVGRTGRVVRFAVQHEERRDGETLFWRLVPARPTDRRQLGLALIIFND